MKTVFEFKEKWLKHIKKPNYSQAKIDEMEDDLYHLIQNIGNEILAYQFTITAENGNYVKGVTPDRIIKILEKQGYDYGYPF